MKKTIFSLTLFIFILAGCSAINESFTDGYGTDPNNPSEAPGNVIFRSGSVAMILFMTDQAARQANLWTQHYTGSDRQYSSLYAYTTFASDYDNMWTTAYVDALVSFKDAKSRILESQTNVRSVIDLSEALTISTLGALFGGVPYTQALDADVTLSPTYDSQDEIYSAAMGLIDGAISDLEGATNLPDGWDIHSYGGDAQKWLKFAYSLKARLLMHQKQYTAALAAASNGILALDGSDDFEFVHGGLADQDQNLWFAFSVERSGYLDAQQSFAVSALNNRMSADSIKNDESERLTYFYKQNKDLPGDYNDFNDKGAFAPATNTPGFIAAETHLIMAEALARSNQKDTAIAHLNNARQYWNNKFDSNGLVDYVASDFATDDDLLNEIYMETYLSLNSQIEAFTFLRRINWDISGLSPTNGSSFPQRYLYPQSEVNSNTNTPEQTTSDLFVPLPLFQQ